MPGGILLDAKIRDYVLLPIFLVVVMISMLRNNILAMFKSDPKVDLKEVKTNNMLTRCRMLKAGHAWLGEKKFSQRKAYFVKKDVGVLVKDPPKAKDPMEMLSGGGAGGPDPMMAMGMMKNQMVFMVSQGVLAYWVSHLFSGFVVAKTPFPLGFPFKAMTQRGVDVLALEPGYVSSLCWYMFVMMCSHSLAGLVTAMVSKADVDAGDDPMMAMMGSMGGGGGAMMGGGPDMAKVYKQEQESLEILGHEFLLQNIETELFQKWRSERN